MVTQLGAPRVSVPSDEPLCVGATFDLDVTKITEAPPDRQMEVLWSLMDQSERGMASRMIFNVFPRIATEGYRWPPRTLQRRAGDPLGDLWSRHPYDVKAVITPRGLRIKAGGWKVQMSRRPWAVPEDWIPKGNGPVVMRDGNAI